MSSTGPSSTPNNNNKGLPPKPPTSSDATTNNTNNNSSNNNASSSLPLSSHSYNSGVNRRKLITRRRSTSAVVGGGSIPTKKPPAIPKPGEGLARQASTQSSSASSSQKRSALQSDVTRYSHHTILTLSEVQFLQSVVDHGTEEQVQTAHDKLLDPTLFDQPVSPVKQPTETEEEHQPLDAVSKAWLANGSHASSNTSSVLPAAWSTDVLGQTSTTTTTAAGGDQSVVSETPSSLYLSSSVASVSDAPPQLPRNRPLFRSSTSSVAGDSVGSERRLQVLQQRRQQEEDDHQIMWVAHESGLAVTQHASRHSLLVRQHHQRQSSAIFRQKSLRLVQQHSTSMMMNQSDTLVRRRRSTLTSTTGGSPARPSWSSSASTGRKPSLRRMASEGSSGTLKPPLRRLLSDSSRKSVTFSAVDERRPPRRATAQRSASVASIPSLHMAHSIRSTAASIPSLHRAHSIRSTASATTLGSTITAGYPSIPHVQAMRSYSVASSVGGEGLYYTTDDNDDDDKNKDRLTPTKQVADLFPRIPTRVEIPPPTRSLLTRYDSSLECTSPREASSSSVMTPYDSSYPGDEKKMDDISNHNHKVLLDEPPRPEEEDDDTKKETMSLPMPSESDLLDPSLLVVPSGQAANEPQQQEETNGTAAVVPPRSASFRRPVLMRDVSMGEGVEVADFAIVGTTPAHATFTSPVHRGRWAGGTLSHDEYDYDYDYEEGDEPFLQMANSFDETMSYRRMSDIFRRPIQRSISDEAAAGLFVGTPIHFLRDSQRGGGSEPMGESWQMDDDDDDDDEVRQEPGMHRSSNASSELDYYDPWLVIEDEYENGYGGGGTLPFQIIGTSAQDASARPHVLSPPLMESLQQFLPFRLTGENFWLKYSLVRDGASMHTFLKHARNAKSSILAVETTDGEVFGSFTSDCWRKNWNFFGSADSFLWRMRHVRGCKSRSIIDQAHRESEIDVFPYTGENNSIQYCINDRLAVGGGHVEPTKDAKQQQDDKEEDHPIKDHEWGYGLCLQGDLLEGTSSPCLTFGSPSLSRVHADGSRFEVINVELWAMTPCYSLAEAEKLELGKLFLEQYNHPNGVHMIRD